MEKMLINATQGGEIRVALVRDNRLYDLDIDCPTDEKKKGNIYKATVTRREPSLDAVFVEYGSKRQGFLPFKEISPEYFSQRPETFGDERPPITSLIHEGQELLIQVDKEERGTKGAAITTYITLAGCFLVLMPNNPNSGGISRRIEGDDRDELRETLGALSLPENMGLIIRTAGVGKQTDELQGDLNMLLHQWECIQDTYKKQLAPSLIHQEGDVIIRSIRDNLRKTIDEIIIDDQISYVKAKQYIEQVKPDFLPHLKLYNNTVPLFNLYQIESQIETAYQREVLLPSGGSLVIDRTEALISIDINSAKATGASDIETTAFNTNLEAADEIARQLRLRDLGGLVVIDFIDMSSSQHQRTVENRLKEALQGDRARIQVGRISRFGLLEMSRQRLRLALGETEQETCPRCDGRGTVRNIQSSSLSIIRLVEEEALKDKTLEIHVQLPPDVATFIMNEKRAYILNIEKRHHIHILIIANPYLIAPQYQITRVKEDSNKSKKLSYDLIEKPNVQTPSVPEERQPASSDLGAISHPYAVQSQGILKKFLHALFGRKEKETRTVSTSTSTSKARTNQQARPHARGPQSNTHGPQRNRRGGHRNKNTRGNAHPQHGNVQVQAQGQVQSQGQAHQGQGARKKHPQHNPRSQGHSQKPHDAPKTQDAPKEHHDKAPNTESQATE